MSNFVITIARGFGSGGKQTAIQLSEILSISYYDKEILKMASEDSGITEKRFSQVDEKLRGNTLVSRLKRHRPAEEVLTPESSDFVNDNNLFEIQSKIIRRLADMQSCIIIGKCADYILSEYKNVVSVYIEAPRADCVRSIVDGYGVDIKQANKMISSTDKYRSDYYKYYTGGNEWTNPVNYDLVLNSSRVGRQACAEVIKSYLQIKGFI